MMLWWLAVNLAFADDSCATNLAPLDGRLSVAWVAPVGERVRRHRSLWVVPTSELAEWTQREEPSAGALLRRLGLRKRKSEPKKRYMVTVFDVEPAELCRPLDEENPPPILGGVPSCDNGQGRSTQRYTGCGYTTDGATGRRGFDVYRIEWEDAAARGFCVLPLDRFLREAGTRASRK
jgi:hypothetical protein